MEGDTFRYGRLRLGVQERQRVGYQPTPTDVDRMRIEGTYHCTVPSPSHKKTHRAGAMCSLDFSFPSYGEGPDGGYNGWACRSYSAGPARPG